MRKILFNDKYGLTEAVLKGNKTMTRGICKKLSTLCCPDICKDKVITITNQ